MLQASLVYNGVLSQKQQQKQNPTDGVWLKSVHIKILRRPSWGRGLVVEHMPVMYKALSLIPSTAETKYSLNSDARKWENNRALGTV